MLTIGHFDGTIGELESFLLLTPSLVHLTVISGEEMINGKRWEQFIEIHLLYLDRFEFLFEEQKQIERILADIELIIALFGTPFWIERKTWFVACEYNSNHHSLCVYSLPICKSSLEHRPQLSLSLNQSLADHIYFKVCSILLNLTNSMFLTAIRKQQQNLLCFAK